ncbi:MAG: cation diffusion facilitator family transporter, partial [Isosphaeraceae bacterium]
MTRDRPGKYHLYREAVQATWLGLVVNLLLGCAKLAGGLVGRSHALISDAVNSLGDVFTSVAVLLAFRVAQKPADAEHPYGHTRAEAIAGSNVAVLVIVSALLVGWGALQGFSPLAHEVPPVWTLAIAGSNVVIKEALYQYKIRLGR